MSRFQEIKEKTKRYREALYNSPSDFNHNFSAMDDIKWLIQKVEDLESINIKTHQKATERIIELEKDIQFFKNRQKLNNIITQELVELNDPRIVSVLTKARIVKLD